MGSSVRCEIDLVLAAPPGASPKLGAFVAQIDPLDRFVRLRRSLLTQANVMKTFDTHSSRIGVTKFQFIASSSVGQKIRRSRNI